MSEIQQKRSLHSTLATSFLVTLGIGLLSFAIPLVSLDAKVSGAWIGTGFAGFFLARLLASPVGGAWSDRIGPRIPLLVSLGCGILIPLLYFIRPSVTALFVVQAGLGVISGLVRPVILAIVGGHGNGDEGVRHFRFHAAAFNSAMFIGPLAGGVLYLQGTVSHVLVCVFCCLVLAFAIASVGIPKALTTQRDRKRQKMDAVSDNPGLSALMIALFGRSLGIGLTLAFYPILLSSMVGRNGLLIGFLFSLTGLATCLGLPVGAYLKKRFPFDCGLSGLLISGVALFLVGSCVQVWQFAVAGIGVGLGAALSIPETMALASKASINQGRVFGLTSVMTGLGLVFGPLLGGFMVRYTHDVGTVFMIAGLIGCLFLAPWAYRRSKMVLVTAVTLFLFFGVAVKTEFVDSDDGLYRYTDVAMGTVVNLTLEADSQKAANDSARKVFKFMRTIQHDLDYRAHQGSIARINQGAGKYFVEPTNRVYHLLQRAVEFSEETGGAFDPTIGALTTSPLYYALDETVAQSRRHLVDYRRVIFDMVGKRIRLAEEGMALDMGGIAKGAIIDASVKLLKKLNIKAGIVEAGGDFYGFGDRDWKVGIRYPRSDGVYATLTIREQGVCGSGDYQQFVQFEEDGESVVRHHIINPRDMEPAGESAGVTVVASNAELADAMATALFVMGPGRGLDFVRKKYPKVEAMWFTPDMRAISTDDFPKK